MLFISFVQKYEHKPLALYRSSLLLVCATSIGVAINACWSFSCFSSSGTMEFRARLVCIKAGFFTFFGA